MISGGSLTSGTHAYRWRRENLQRLAFVRWNSVFSKLTKATSDRISSAPIPAPRMRPSHRKKTTTAKATHSTLMVMRALRASSVMPTYIISAMMGKTWSGKGLFESTEREGLAVEVTSREMRIEDWFSPWSAPPWESLAILDHSSRAGQREACLAHRGMVTVADNHPPCTEFRSGGRVPWYRVGAGIGELRSSSVISLNPFRQNGDDAKS